MAFVEVDRPVDGVAVVTLNRPERMNAMSFDVMVPFRQMLVDLGYDNSLRAVVITGAGRGFCSGADQEFSGIPPRIDGVTRPTIGLRTLEILDEVIRAIRHMHQPVIAAINGAAIGGGLCLAAACDIRVAAHEAYFRAAGINNGLTASELGLSFMLPRLIGQGRAAELMLTGRDMDAAEALRIGLVTSVVDDSVAAAVEIGQRIGQLSQPGIEITKRTLWTSMEASSLDAHMHAEGIGQLYMRLLTANFEEATRARKEGRAAVFTDDLA